MGSVGRANVRPRPTETRIPVTLPPDKHTRPLTRRQRHISEGWLIPSPKPLLGTRGKYVRKPFAAKDQATLDAERRDKIVKIIGMPLEVWRQQIQDEIQTEENKIEEQKQLEKLQRKELSAQERRDNRRGRSKRYYQEFYGPSWFPVQAEAMARSKGICEICKTSKADQVHHILPIRYFLDSEDAHFINNTLAVCAPCHNKEHQQMKYRFPLFNHLKLKLCKPGRVKLCAPSLLGDKSQ